MPKPKFKPAQYHGGTAYDVFIDGVEEPIGTIVKKIDHYNLRRPVTTTSWKVQSTVNQFVRDEAGYISSRQTFNTRGRAAEMLVQAYLEKQKWEWVPPIPGGNEDVYRCLSDCCGALCRAQGRHAHDLAFHAEEIS